MSEQEKQQVLRDANTWVGIRQEQFRRELARLTEKAAA